MCIECTYPKIEEESRKIIRRQGKWTFENVNIFLESKNISIRIIRPELFENSVTKTWCVCLNCKHEWLVRLCNILIGKQNGCPNCLKQLRWSDEKADQFLKDNSLNFKILTHITGNKQKIECECNICKHHWFTTLKLIMHTKNHCPYCNDRIPWSNERFDEYIAFKKLNIIRIGNSEFRKKRQVFKVQCNICKHVYYTTPLKIQQGHECLCCTGSLPWTNNSLDKLISEKKLHIKRIGDVINSKTTLQFKCLDCKQSFLRCIIAIRSGQTTCPNCSDWKINENLTGQYLQELLPNYCNDPEFHDRFKIQISKTLKVRVDFKLMINGIPFLVEYQGHQHYGPVRFGGMSIEKATKIFNEYQVPRDTAEREWCKKNGILLFEIDGRKYTGEKIRKYIIENIICKLPS